MSRWHIGETDYPAIRRVMGPQRDRYDDEELEDLLERVFPGADPEAVENFMKTMQQFGKQAAPLLQKVGPGMAQGAMQGAALGPWGALAGALGGGAASLLGGGGPGASAGAPRPVAPSPVPAPAAAPLALAAPAGAVPAAGAAAPAQLLSLLSRPETMQALLSMAMGQLGRGTVSLGQHQVPAPAFANAIAEVASEVAHLAGRPKGDDSRYWFDSHGAPRCDVANPAACAALLWNDLVEAIEAEDWEEEEDIWQEDDEEEDEQEESEEDESMDYETSPLARYESALNGAHPDDD